MKGSSPEPPMLLHPLAWVAAILPLLTIHASFVMSVAEGLIPACIPYWLDCTSISQGGRHGSAYFIFKAGMMPTAVLLALFWVLQARWLQVLSLKRQRTLTCLGLVGSMALIVYTLFLGHSGDEYRLLRRFGVVLFMFCTFICHILSAKCFISISKLRHPGQILLRSCALIISLAVLSLILDVSLGDDYERMEDAFEWWLMMALIGNQLFLAYLWRSSRLSARLASLND